MRKPGTASYFTTTHSTNLADNWHEPPDGSEREYERLRRLENSSSFDESGENRPKNIAHIRPQRVYTRSGHGRWVNTNRGLIKPHGSRPCGRLPFIIRGAGRVVPFERSHTVDVNRILSELREERANIIDAIANLERLARGRGKRRGRPPKWLAEAREQRKRGPGRPRKRRAAA